MSRRPIRLLPRRKRRNLGYPLRAVFRIVTFRKRLAGQPCETALDCPGCPFASPHVPPSWSVLSGFEGSSHQYSYVRTLLL